MVVKADFNFKITEVKNKIRSISGLATNSALTVVENKIPDISGLVTKPNYNTKIREIEKKVIGHNLDKNSLLLQNLILYLQWLLMQD